MYKILFSILLCGVLLQPVNGQTHIQLVREGGQKSFAENVPAGNYSGITYIGNDEYAVVSDKAPEDGFFVFKITIDSITGNISQIVNLGFRSSHKPNRDEEGIAYLAARQTILISGEGDMAIKEYGLDGIPTGREAAIPKLFHKASANLGFEALTYSSATKMLWTCNESTLPGDGEQADGAPHVKSRIRLQAFDESLQPVKQYAYQMDEPLMNQSAGQYIHGVPELVALADGSLLVLEREFFVAESKLGSFVNCKLFQVFPALGQSLSTENSLTVHSPFLEKTLVHEWQTSVGLLDYDIANYEGMCLGPRLHDGSQVLILVADSQNQYAGILQDWFKVLILK